jgi:hypothetical protein
MLVLNGYVYTDCGQIFSSKNPFLQELLYNMKIVSLYAELQTNPRNVSVYRQLAEHYKSCNRHNEAQAFMELIERKYAERPPSDEKQRSDSDQST